MTSPDSPSLSTEIDMDRVLKRLAHGGGPFDFDDDVQIINWLANRELFRRAPALSEGEPTPTIAELRGEVIAARHALLGRRIEGHLMPEGGCSICTVLLKDSVPRKFYDDLFADWQRIRIAANGEFGHQQAEIQEWQNRLRDTLAELDASRAPALSEGEPTPARNLTREERQDFDDANKPFARKVEVVSVSPSLSTSSPPELKKLLDELESAAYRLCEVSRKVSTVEQQNVALDRQSAARSAIELSFATLTEEIKRLKTEAESGWSEDLWSATARLLQQGGFWGGAKWREQVSQISGDATIVEEAKRRYPVSPDSPAMELATLRSENERLRNELANIAGALTNTGIGGIFDVFADPADAITQMALRIKELEPK